MLRLRIPQNSPARLLDQNFISSDTRCALPMKNLLSFVTFSKNRDNLAKNTVMFHPKRSEKIISKQSNLNTRKNNNNVLYPLTSVSLIFRALISATMWTHVPSSKSPISVRSHPYTFLNNFRIFIPCERMFSNSKNVFLNIAPRKMLKFSICVNIYSLCGMCLSLLKH